MERSIDVQISRLRRMVEEDRHIQDIQTVWGWATSSYRTVLSMRRMRFSPRSSFARTLLLIVTLLFVSAVI